MTPRFRQRTALLLVAILAMLPLQGVLAAVYGPAGQSVAATADTPHHAHMGHGDHAMHAGGCPMHQPGAKAAQGGSHCSGGCDMCGACSATLPPSLQMQPLFAHALPTPTAETAHPARPAYPLFRPPRA